jgi:hypothetical protein
VQYREASPLKLLAFESLLAESPFPAWQKIVSVEKPPATAQGRIESLITWTPVDQPRW